MKCSTPIVLAFLSSPAVVWAQTVPTVAPDNPEPVAEPALPGEPSAVPEASPAAEAGTLTPGGVTGEQQAVTPALPAEPTPTVPMQPEMVAAPEPMPPPPVADLPPAPPPIGLIPKASMFTRYELRHAYDDLGVSRQRFLEGDGMAARMRLGLRTTDVDLGNGGTVAVQFTPQASGFWGIMPQQTSDANLGLHEGYVHWVPGQAFALDVGRIELNYGDSFIIGSLDWHETGRSFDGFRGRFTPTEGAWIDVIVTQLAEGRGVADTDTDVGANDVYFGGIYASVGKAIGMNGDLEPYLLFNAAPATHLAPADPVDKQTRKGLVEGTLGVRVKGEAGIFDYRAEPGVQFGRRVATPASSVVAYQLDAEVGVKVAPAKLRLALEGFYASGDDPTTTDKNEGWNQQFPTGHKWLGLMDVIAGRNDVAGGTMYVTYAAPAPVSFMLQGHVFASTVDRPLAGDEVLEAGYRGSEVDFQIMLDLGKGLKLRTLNCVFVPNDEAYPDDRTAFYSETELRLDF